MEENFDFQNSLSYYPVLKKYINVRISKGRYLVHNFRTGNSDLETPSNFFFLSLCNGSQTLQTIRKLYQRIFSLSEETATEQIQQMVLKYSDFIQYLPSPCEHTHVCSLEQLKISTKEWNYSPLRDENPRSLTISLTEACNHQCNYCFKSCDYTSQKEVPVEKWCSVIAEACDMGIQEVTFSGGEPFLYKDFLSLVEYSNQKGMYCKISTNGTYLDEQTIKQLHSVGAEYIHLSLPAVNSFLYDSITASSGDLPFVKEAISLLKQYGFYIRVKMVLTPDNTEEAEALIDFCAHQKIDFVHLAPFILTQNSRGSNALIPTEKDLICIKNMAIKKLEQYKNMEIGLPPIGSLKWNNSQSIARCGGIKDSLTILSNGTITLCEAAANLEGFSLGTIFDQSLSDLWNSEKPDQITDLCNKKIDPICSECEYLTDCKTGCFVFSYLQSGNPWSIDPRCFQYPDSHTIFTQNKKGEF